MRDYITIASSPIDESCAQVGADDYAQRSALECRLFIEQLKRLFGPEPQGARLARKAFPHDFGTYHEVVCWYDDDYPESVDYAYKLEANTPTEWDSKAKEEIAAFTFRKLLGD